MHKRNAFTAVLGLGLTLCARSTEAQNNYNEEMARWSEQQKRHVTKMFDLYIEELQDEHIPHMTMSITDDLLNARPNHTLDLLENYARHDSPNVRADAMRMARRLGDPSRDSEVRRRATSLLVSGCLDADGSVRTVASRLILNFRPEDFSSPGVADKLARFLDEPIKDDLLLVLGLTNDRGWLHFLKKLSDKHYTAVLARARLGDDDAARQAIDRVRNAKNPRLLMQHYLEQLGYTRHPIVLAYLTAFLDRSDRLIDVPASDYYVPRYDQLCTQIIAKNFRECPVKYEKIRFRVTDADIAAVKTWAKKKLRESAED